MPTFVVAITAMPAMIAMASEVRRTRVATRWRGWVMTSPDLMESFQPTESSRLAAFGADGDPLPGVREQGRLAGVHVILPLVGEMSWEQPNPSRNISGTYFVSHEIDTRQEPGPAARELDAQYGPLRLNKRPRSDLHSTVDATRMTSRISGCHPTQDRAPCVHPVKLHRQLKGEK